VVDRDGLENRCACKRTVGSNPTLSAISSIAAILLRSSAIRPAADVRRGSGDVGSSSFRDNGLIPIAAIVRLGDNFILKTPVECCVALRKAHE
jgi:hypothetical protein